MMQDHEQGRRLGELMRRAQDGDGHAYRELLTLITPSLRQGVRQRIRTLQACDVEDLVQDILLSVHTARATYDPARPFMPWLMAIARNRIADGARRYARRTANEVACAVPPETFEAPIANMLVERYGDGEALARAMARLPPGQRQAVELMKLNELSLREAATVSGMTVGALKVAVHRGMGALRKALGVK